MPDPKGTDLSDLRAALRHAQGEIARLREELDSRRHLVDILHEVMGNLSPSEIFHMLARRLGRALELSQSSVVLARPGDKKGIVAVAFEQPSLENLEVNLERYPEISAALEEQKPILIKDIHASPWYGELRKVWDREGITVTVRSIIALPFSLDRDTSGVFLLRRDTERPEFDDDDVEFASTVVKSALAAIQRAHAVEVTMADNARLEALAHTDPLTQLPNRRALRARTNAEMERTLRYGSTFAVLMVDLDHFKKVNDTQGHLAGDAVLAEFAALLLRSSRSVDIVARYGGEEFVLVLPETAAEGATSFAERLRERVEEHEFHGDTGPLQMTASIGVATYPAAGVDGMEGLFAKADAALYQAKQEGRNRVCA